ncbi:TadE/TadG family type IV pilus assembly protein [Mesorhizobium yinganensis]|uniref:TadE/TadG family type IV pilus assembly protein n=1 Tax=Mesorhizobium yinganensis TaxID=3157707 RepID=UPI0032B6FFF5
MFRKFWADRRGNYAMITVICMLPMVGGLALAIDYAELTRERAQALSALDAAGIAAARVYLEGMEDADVEKYARDFFEANANGLDMSKVTLTLVLPKDNAGGGTLKLSAATTYDPYFLPALTSMLGSNAVTSVAFSETSEVRLKNTLEVALVLDNSGSMSEKGGSSSTMRMDLLKKAAKELVTTLSAQADQMTQVVKPVQFSLVPFAASVNIGPDNADKTWMDQDGISPIHHENFDWTTMSKANYGNSKYVENVGGIWYKKGTGWGTEENKKVTRFSLYKDLQRISGYTAVKTGTVCSKTKNGKCTEYQDVYENRPNYAAFAAWKGCVEARPSPYDVDDTVPSTGTPATLFVPMFAPDESDPIRSYNNWWPDQYTDTENNRRQKFMPKYFDQHPQKAVEGIRAHDKAIIGPNQSCTTTAITPLTDTSVAAGKTTINNAIDAMQPLGATNVPEGMAWGWRTVSSTLPFTGGRPESDRGNDKVVIVVTDGANTYYTPDSLGDENGNPYSDSTGNRSIYSSLGYTRLIVDTTKTGRIFQGTSTSIPKTTFTNANYTAAMNEHFKALCNNSAFSHLKADLTPNGGKIIVMTVALDLDEKKAAEKTQIGLLKDCASPSRIDKNKILFWNATGATLDVVFEEIANELSNLRIVG